MSSKYTLLIRILIRVNKKHGGNWYNYEQEQLYNSSGNHYYTALKESIDLDDIAIISAYLLNTNNDHYNLITYNCTHFATNLWNSISSRYITNHQGLPSNVLSSINTYSLTTNNIPYNNYGDVGYYKNGNFQVTSQL